MRIRPISEWALYRFRFGLSYLLLAILVGLAVGLSPGSMPPGLGHSEQESVIASTNLSLTQLPTTIIDLPYHLLQKASVHFLDITPLGVRLPSLIVGALTAFMLALLLRRWFKTNVAIVASLIVLTAAWFISTVRLGAPLIMVPFWTTLILLAATYIAQETKHWRLWKVVLALAAALSLYTPFMIYLYVAAFVASLTQPHLRYLLRRSSMVHITLASIVFLALLVPLGWGIYKDMSQLWQLAAIPAILPEPMAFGQGIVQAASNLFNPYNVSFGQAITPLVSLATLALIIMGAARLLKDSHAIRAHMLLVWGAILVPIVGLNPSNLVVLLVPVTLVGAIGVQLIIAYWYRLFPFNPYARVFGLIPLAVLIVSIVPFNNQRYVHGMLYGEQTAAVFNNDAFLAQKAIHALPAGVATLVVPEDDQQLYRIIAKHRPDTQVTSGSQVNLTRGTWIIAESELNKVATLPNTIPTQLIVNDHKDKALRFRVYQR